MFPHYVLLCVLLIFFVYADEPIVDLYAKCPPSPDHPASLHLVADVPAFAQARCRNGEKAFVPVDPANMVLDATFSQNYTGTDCQFYRKVGVDTYTLTVEVGWGEEDRPIITKHKIHTITCSYDDHGSAQSREDVITDWHLNPLEIQTLLGGNASADFDLKVIDVLGREIRSDNIAMGRLVQLKATDTSGNVSAFRALSCAVQNSQSRYYILRAGCGDGLVFPKVSGFKTEGNKVTSPYFRTFQLGGPDNSLQFECRFTVCSGLCDGDSCSVETSGRIKRSLPDLTRTISAKSAFYKTTQSN